MSKGKAVVFEDNRDLLARIDDPQLNVPRPRSPGAPGL
jgi:hypothetical protein